MTTALKRMGRAELLSTINRLDGEVQMAVNGVQKFAAIAQQQQGRITELEAVNARFEKNHAIMLENLTATQAVSTRLTNEARGVRHFLNNENSPRLVIALHAIMGAAYAAECKHGPFAPRLTRIPDGTGGDHLAKLRDAFQRECSEAEANGTVSWGLLASEEFFEAMAEQDPIALRAEVAQLGAVCAAWIRAIDERGAK